MNPPVGSVAVRFQEGVGFAVYVQTGPEVAEVVWSQDMLAGVRPERKRAGRPSIADYGTVVYEPPESGHRPSEPRHPSDWT